MPIQGLTRLRKHQFGRQSDRQVKVTAARAYPFSGVPSVDLQWTDPEVDTGTLAETVPPFRGPGEFTAPLTDPNLAYNNIPLIMDAFFGGNIDPSGGGTAKTWVHDVDVTQPIDQSLFTYEFGDDVLTDWYQLGDGYLESLEVAGPDGLGPVTTSMGFRFGSASSTGSTDSPVTGTVPTPGLSVDTAPTLVYLKDMGIYIASTIAGLGAGQVTDALHNFTLRFTKEFDEKRWANGSQSFDVDDVAITKIGVELEATWAKTSDIVGTSSESDAWFSDDSVNRYVRLLFTSLAVAQTPSTFYSWEMIMPMRYRTREEGAVGGNSVVILSGNAWYDPSDFTGFFRSTVVNTLAVTGFEGTTAS